MMNTEGLCLGCMSDNGGEKICPICGFDADTKNPADFLPAKSVIQNRYYLGKALYSDGEGVTYIGWDDDQKARVLVKEYFPTGFAVRNPDKTVAIAEGGKYTFNEGLLEFIDINRTIMSSALPALIQVYDIFEENGTAYAIKEYVSGITLGEFLDKNGGTLKWEQARPLFLPVIDTVGGMNELGYIHGGISTDTIIVGRDGKLRVSEYCIKKLRRTDSELNFKIYTGFAACEQYGFIDMHVDTYTDVYGLCATLFRVLIGTVPPDASQRIHNDVMTIPAKFVEELPRQVLAALANGLQVLPQNRTKNIEIFKNELVYGEIAEKAPAPKPAPKEVQPKKKSSSAKYALISALCTVFVFLAIALILIFTVFKDVVFNKNTDLSSNGAGSISAPQVASLGEVESGAELPDKLYKVPDLQSRYYSEIEKDHELEMFEFVIKDKEFSSTCPKGTVCGQSVKPGTEVLRDTKIELIISLGPKEIKIANLIGLDETSAKMELLKQGFLYENIKVYEKYDEDREPGVVLEQFPKYGDTVSTDILVEIYVNPIKDDITAQTTSRRSETFR